MRLAPLLAALPLVAGCMSFSPPGPGHARYHAPPPAAEAHTGYPAAGSVGASPSRAEAQTERPGLGTSWGETRRSRVRDVPFERATPSPFAVATLFYNDRDGVDAMVRHDARAQRPLDTPVTVRGGLTVAVVDDNGLPLPSFAIGGRIYVVGQEGGRYAIQVSNHTGRRYEAVASVDGLDVVDGTGAAVDKRGYVLDPFGSLTIDGFRRSREAVAAFRFGAVADSYAARTAGDRNVGVIGVALFAERGSEPWSDDEIERRQGATPFEDARYAQPPG